MAKPINREYTFFMLYFWNNVLDCGGKMDYDKTSWGLGMLSALLRVQQNSWMVGNLCRCKENVEGRSCNNCKPGTFGLDPGWKKERKIVKYGKFPLETIPSDEEQGCLKCYCSGVTDECSDARSVPSSSSSLLQKVSPLLCCGTFLQGWKWT